MKPTNLASVATMTLVLIASIFPDLLQPPANAACCYFSQGQGHQPTGAESIHIVESDSESRSLHSSAKVRRQCRRFRNGDSHAGEAEARRNASRFLQGSGDI